MNKEKARKYIDLYLQNLLKVLRNELKDKVKASVIQCSDINDMDSHARQFQTLKEEQNINERIKDILKAHARFRNLPIAKTEKVQEGALIEIKKFYIYAGVVTPVISKKEKDIIGISTSAPIYKTLFNQKVGFKFKFNGTDCVILSIQ